MRYTVSMDTIITPDLLLEAYAQGAFPMADSREANGFHFYRPEKRGILPLDAGFNIPRSLKKIMPVHGFKITHNMAFEDVIRACAALTTSRKDTWINDDIIALYCQLHQRKRAHSIECWQEETLVGGLYGVQLGGAFCGESMFSRVPQASKVALVTLVDHLRAQGFTLLDTQYVNDHLKQFGVQEIPDKEYQKQLKLAMRLNCRF